MDAALFNTAPTVSIKTGDVHAHSAGADYPYIVIAVGINNVGDIGYRAINLHANRKLDDKIYRTFATYAEARADIARLKQPRHLQQYVITEVGTFQWTLHDVRSGSIQTYRSRSEATIALFGFGARNLINE